MTRIPKVANRSLDFLGQGDDLPFLFEKKQNGVKDIKM